MLLALFALLAGFATYSVRGSLAQLEGNQPLSGLTAAATIERDAGGVATISATNASDAARALGFVHAQERYFEMDLLRRSAAGELAALFGPVAIARDRQLRVHRMRSRMHAAIERLDAGHLAVLNAYVSGVNQGLDGLRNRPWPYLVLRQTPQPWLAEDSFLAVAAMAFDLHDSSNRREYMFSRLDHYLPAELMSILSADGSEFDAPLMGEVRPAVTLPSGPLIDAVVDPAARPGDAEPVEVEGAVDGVATGSNNFAVAGSLTSDGRAILADDMHLGLRAPNIWFRAHLHYADPHGPNGQVDVSGFSLPGVPGIVAGSNGKIAWGFTNSYGDWLDWVEIIWIDREGGRYRTIDGEEQVRVIEETIEVAGASNELLSVRETRWGPIFHDPPDNVVHVGDASKSSPDRQEDSEGEGGDQPSLALMWTMHRPGGIDLGLFDLAAANSLDEAVTIANRLGMPAQNLLIADHDGRIGWTIAGRIPQRTGNCDPQRPLNPLAGCDWLAEWLPPAQTPQVLDPSEGRLWSANSRVADGEALKLIGAGSYDLGARQRQIRDGLSAKQQFSETDLLAIQLDTRALFLKRWWKLLREVTSAASSEELQRLHQTTTTWEGHAGVDAVSYRMARAFRGKVIERIATALFARAKATEGERWQEPVANQLEGLVWPLIQQKPDGWLAPEVGGWDALLAAAATDVVTELEAVGPLPQRTWGERNTARICHPLAGALPAGIADSLCMTREPLPGDSHMPRVQGVSFGASQRMVVAPGHEADGIINAPAGQSGHPLSPFWSAGHNDWSEGRASAFLPGATVYTLQLTP
ncbi:MAG: penicillin acylase family protein [Pseudomarimonas sp.]